uniref:Holin n=1 Tax=viral metagenome TaxID=1070528 RepID=A0A6H1ZGD5_9ZZZZ
MDIIEYVGSIGGVAGVLATFIFLSYRYLVNQMREDRKFMEDRLTNVTKDYNAAIKERNETMVKHTAILTELIIWLKTKNGHK